MKPDVLARLLSAGTKRDCEKQLALLLFVPELVSGLNVTEGVVLAFFCDCHNTFLRAGNRLGTNRKKPGWNRLIGT